MSIAGHVMLRRGLAASDHKQMAMYFPSWPLLEAAIRRRVVAIDNVDIRDSTDVAELTRRVTGVTVTNGDDTARRRPGRRRHGPQGTHNRLPRQTWLQTA